MTTYKISLWRRVAISIAGLIGLIYILPFILKFQGFTLESLFYLIISIILILAAILTWFTKVAIEESGITVPATSLLPKVYKIPWSSIQAIHRYPKGAMALVFARYGMVYGIEIEFTEGPTSKKVRLNIGGFSNREKLLNEISSYAGAKMSETPSEIHSKSERSFLGFWGVYLFIILVILIFIFLTYSKLISLT